MQSGLVGAVCQIGIFMICAQAMVHFRPKASYEKYLKMLLSAMIMIQILASLGGIFSASGRAQLSERLAYFTESLNESMQQASDFAIFSEESSEMDILGDLPERRENGSTGEGVGRVSIQIEPVTPIEIGAVK